MTASGPGPTTEVSAPAYVEVLTPTLQRVATSNAQAIGRAADLLAESLRADGVVQAFGSGHSQALAMEVAGRAGGLVPTNQLAVRDLVVFGGEPPELLSEHGLERDPEIARRIYDLANIAPQDVFVIGSSSGVNGSIVEMASIVKEAGHPLIAITSLQHTGAVESRHPSGRKLADLADVVLDNGAPRGDAVLPLPGGGAVCAVSSITAALLVQMLTAEVVRRLLESGETPPVYLSANVPEGDQHNDALEARYAGRIRRTA
ncbi:MAG TPA: SIS domain-containing protein [Segeticoccus sp.]|nr:SIS domain-containing protein [Segeticoccus sp.]